MRVFDFEAGGGSEKSTNGVAGGGEGGSGGGGDSKPSGDNNPNTAPLAEASTSGKGKSRFRAVGQGILQVK